MIYPIGNTTIDSDKYKDQFASLNKLLLIKEIVDMSGCSLREAKELVDRIIREENIIG